MNIGECIKAARKKAGLTQAELGARCGMADSAIRKYESGRQLPKIETAKRIALGLGISIFDLIGVDPSDTFGKVDILTYKFNSMIESVLVHSDIIDSNIEDSTGDFSYVTEDVFKMIDEAIDELKEKLTAFIENECKK